MTKHDGVKLRHWPAPQTHNTLHSHKRASLKLGEKIWMILFRCPPRLSIVRLWIVLRSNDLIEEVEREDGNSNYFLLS